MKTVEGPESPFAVQVGDVCLWTPPGEVRWKDCVVMETGLANDSDYPFNIKVVVAGEGGRTEILSQGDQNLLIYAKKGLCPMLDKLADKINNYKGFNAIVVKHWKGSHSWGFKLFDINTKCYLRKKAEEYYEHEITFEEEEGKIYGFERHGDMVDSDSEHGFGKIPLPFGLEEFLKTIGMQYVTEM